MKSHKLFFVCSILFCLRLYAQQPVILNLKEDINLPDTEFYGIVEDKKGFIWLAASKGLFRYDGKDFIKFENDTKKGRSVFDLSLDAQNRLWCVNIAAQLFYAENDQLYTHADLGELVNFTLIDITIFKEQIYAFSMNKITKVDRQTGALETIFSSNKRIGTPYVTDEKLIFNAGETIFQIQNARVTKVLSDEKLQVQYPEETKKGSLLEDASKSLYCFKFWETKGYRLFVKHEGQQAFQEVSLPEDLQGKVMIRFVKINDQFWFCTDKGVYVYEIYDHTWMLKNKYHTSYFITDVLVDAQKNIWFTTLKNGLFLMPNLALQRKSFGHTQYHISAIKKMDKHHMLIGTNLGAILKYNVTDESYTILREATGQRIHFISERLFDDSFLFVENYQIIRLKNDTIQPCEGGIFSGIKYIANYKDSLLTANYDSSRLLYQHKTSYQAHSLLDSNRANIIYHDTIRNTIYMGAIDDFKLITAKGDKKKIQYNNASLFITALAQTSDGSIWVGTSKYGILKVRHDKIVQTVAVADGLLSNDINILKADGIHLWISTDKGIQQYNTVDNTVKSITASDGLTSNTISGLEIIEETVYVATDQDVFSFDKQRIFKSEITPQIYFKKVEKLNEEVPVKDSYTLPYSDNKINFEFHSNGFKSSENIRYEYKIEKSTPSDWQAVNLGNYTVAFTSLSSGEYQFYVRAIDLKSNNISNILSANITVRAPFWLQTWFLVGCIGGIIAMTYLFTQYKARKKSKKQASAFEKLEQEKLLIAANLESLRSQMNPHFIFNALTAIQDYIELNDKKMASEYLVKFSRLIRIYLEQSQQEHILLKEEIEALHIYLELEKERFEDDLHIDFQVDDTLLTKNYIFPSLFLQPYVENAIKHGLLHKKAGTKKLILIFRDAEAQLQITIEDNGIGIQKALELKRTRTAHKSFANSANQTRLQLINQNRAQKIKVDIHNLETANIPSGTRVIITIPKEHMRLT
ncbi:MAG: histidine kinase [Bacteroidota bacterium]